MCWCALQFTQSLHSVRVARDAEASDYSWYPPKETLITRVFDKNAFR